MATDAFTRTSYGRTARFYDFLDTLNYGNVSRRSRNCFLSELPFVPRNPLIVACGTGDFAAAFVTSQRPFRLTINDLSATMLEVAAAKIRNRGWNGELTILLGDITSTDRHAAYDFIALNYILAIFPPKARIEFLKNVLRLLTPGGIVQVADFSRPANPLMLPHFYVNWTLAVLCFWAFSGTRPNVLGNMDAHLAEAGLRVIRKQTFVGGLYAGWLLRSG